MQRNFHSISVSCLYDELWGSLVQPHDVFLSLPLSCLPYPLLHRHHLFTGQIRVGLIVRHLPISSFPAPLYRFCSSISSALAVSVLLISISCLHSSEPPCCLDC